jgi:hypothetical protein
VLPSIAPSQPFANAAASGTNQQKILMIPSCPDVNPEFRSWIFENKIK